MVVERWRALRENASKDALWVEANRARDKRRGKVHVEIADLLRKFLLDAIDVQKLRSVYDRKTRKEWDVFGLKGFSGAMFLNQIVKNLPDKKSSTDMLRTVLPVPDSIDEGRHRLQVFMDHLESYVANGTVTRKQLVPALMPFFVSAWWHMQDVEKWPIFYISARKALAAEGLYESSSDPVQDYFSFRDSFLSLRDALGLSTWELEHLCVRHQERARDGDGLEDQGDETDADDDRTLDLTTARTATSHTRVQWLLAKMGRRLGCKVWIAANDHKKEWEGTSLGSLSLPELPNLGLDGESQDIIRLIDVLWIKGTKQVAAAFEVECTTSVYSGLLRLADLTALSPNLNFPLYIVVPNARLDKVRKELLRPTFLVLELSSRCGFFSEEELFKEADNIMKWSTDPSAIDRLASNVGDSG